MEKQINYSRSILGVALVTLFILSIPLVAMQFTDEVKWSVGDFILMGALLFGTGVLFVLVMRLSSNIVYKTAVGLAIGATFFMIYVNLAVGLIGGGPHAGNLMYAGVILVLIIGIYLSRFTAAGMERAMYLTAGTFAVLTAIAFIAKMYEYPGSSVLEIVGVNVFFATPFVVSGLLFRYVALEQANKNEKAA
ncbi:MAG: hypothetical protein KF803_14130 [Cyclobacteriaceae bacterium]|nr:hypothetical protein [Cyclobacteriaceae bacterium]